MAVLTVGGTEVVLRDDSVQRVDVAIGSVRPAFSGAPRSSVRGYKTTWPLTAADLTRAAGDTLRGLLKAAAPITLTGDLCGSISGYCAGDISVRSSTQNGVEYCAVSFTLMEA